MYCIKSHFKLNISKIFKFLNRIYDVFFIRHVYFLIKCQIILLLPFLVGLLTFVVMYKCCHNCFNWVLNYNYMALLVMKSLKTSNCQTKWFLVRNWGISVSFFIYIANVKIAVNTVVDITNWRLWNKWSFTGYLKMKENKETVIIRHFNKYRATSEKQYLIIWNCTRNHFANDLPLVKSF